MQKLNFQEIYTWYLDSECLIFLVQYIYIRLKIKPNSVRTKI